jgi:hypothetical protein
VGRASKRRQLARLERMIPNDLGRAFLKLCDSTGLKQEVWKQWRLQVTQGGNRESVCLFMINFPGRPSEAFQIVSLATFAQQWSWQLGIGEDGIENLTKMWQSDSAKWYLPPSVVAWADGDPEGDFVAQAICFYGDRRKPFDPNTYCPIQPS